MWSYSDCCDGHRSGCVDLLTSLVYNHSPTQCNNSKHLFLFKDDHPEGAVDLPHAPLTIHPNQAAHHSNRGPSSETPGPPASDSDTNPNPPFPHEITNVGTPSAAGSVKLPVGRHAAGNANLPTRNLGVTTAKPQLAAVCWI